MARKKIYTQNKLLTDVRSEKKNRRDLNTTEVHRQLTKFVVIKIRNLQVGNVCVCLYCGNECIAHIDDVKQIVYIWKFKKI